MGLRDSRAGNVLYLFGTSESVCLRILSNIFFDVKAGWADDIHVYGESPGTAQMKHQGRAAFEDEWAVGELEGFQKGEGPDGFLKEGHIPDVGILGTEGFNPSFGAAFGANHCSESILLRMVRILSLHLRRRA